MIFGWILFWAFMWVGFSKVIWYIKNNEEVEMVLTMSLAHMTFITAEIITHYFSFLPISWVIATVVASIIVWNYGRYKITPKVEAHMQKFWEFFAYVSNSLVFILIWLILSSIDIDFWALIIPILITIPIIMLARAVSIYLPLGAINFFSTEEKVPSSWQHLLSWWSLRWALSLMMVLLIPWVWDAGYEKMQVFEQIVWWNYDFSIKDLLLVLTISSIMFSLFVKASTISILMKKIWISKLKPLEEFEHEEWKILANFKILEKLNNSYKKAYLTKLEYDELLERYSGKLKDSIKKMKEFLSNNKKSPQTLIGKAISLHALWIEKQHLKDLFSYNEIDEKNFKYILRKIEKQVELLDSESSRLVKIPSEEDNYDIFSKLAIKLYTNSSSIVDTYIRNRARVIITRKVIKDLRELWGIDFWFTFGKNDKNPFDEVIDLYATFHKRADEKRIDILVKNKATIMGLESRLVNKSLLKVEEQVFRDLHSKEIITPKLYIKFMEEIEGEIFSDIKRID
jgi:monovalent cation:H+ antiporter, CPA1 family